MKPEQRNQDEQAPMIYRELGRQLRLPEQRISALEQQIRSKAAEQKLDAPVFAANRKKRFRTENWLAYRVAPVAACAMLALTGVLVYRAGMMGNSEFETAESDPDIVVQSDLPVQTDLTTESDAAEMVTAVITADSAHAQTGTDKPQTTQNREPDVQVVQTTAPEEQKQPASAETTSLTTALPPQTTETPVTTKPFTETEPPVTTAEEPPVMTEVVTAPPAVVLPETPENAIFALDNVVGHPGEDVTVIVYFKHDIVLNGFSMYLQLTVMPGDPVPKFVECSNPITKRRIVPICNNDTEKGLYTAAFMSSSDLSIPAGTELFVLTLHIPEDAAPGTVYQLEPMREEDQQKVISSEYPDGMPGEFYIGNIFVE